MYMSRCEIISLLWRDRTFTVAWSVMVWTSSKTISKKYQCKMRSSRITKLDMSISTLQNWISLAIIYTYLSGSIGSVSTPTLSFTNEWRRRSLEVFSKRWSRIFPSQSTRFLPTMVRNSHMNALPSIYDLKGKRISSIEPAKLMASGINWRNSGILDQRAGGGFQQDRQTAHDKGLSLRQHLRTHEAFDGVLACI